MFTLPPEDETSPRHFYDLLVSSAPEFELLQRGAPDVAFLYRTEEKIRAGRKVLGTAYIPGVQGDLSPLFDWLLEYLLGGKPDFLFILDGGYWAGATARMREILMFHEMSHCDQQRDQFGSPKFHRMTGAPLWRIVGHDIEEFCAVVARYGEYDEGVKAFVAAAKAGEAARGAF